MTEEKTPKVIEEGWYDVKVQGWGAGLSQEKKTPFAWVKFDNGLFWRGYWTANTAANTSKQLATMGFNGEKPSDMAGEEALIKGHVVHVLVENEAYNGKTTSKVVWVKEAGAKAELDPSDIKEMDGFDIRAYMVEAKKEVGTVSSQPTTETGAGDIPF